VVGVNTSIATLGGQRSGNIRIGFAVPIERAVDVASDIPAVDHHTPQPRCGRPVPVGAVAGRARRRVVGAVIWVFVPRSNCGEGRNCARSAAIHLSALPDNVVGYAHDQLVNAAHFIQAGRDLGLSCRDLTIGVMTAMGESALTVLNHGDVAGPDSRGLFQHRDNGAWGSYADRMDPHVSALNFLTALEQVDQRHTLEPTIAAHRVQRNADPYHYRAYWSPAQDVVAAITTLYSSA